MSPSGASTLITVAPRSASNRAQYGPAMVVVKSRTRMFPSGRCILELWLRFGMMLPALLDGTQEQRGMRRRSIWRSGLRLLSSSAPPPAAISLMHTDQRVGLDLPRKGIDPGGASGESWLTTAIRGCGTAVGCRIVVAAGERPAPAKNVRPYWRSRATTLQDGLLCLSL